MGIILSGESSVGSARGVFPSVGQAGGYRPARHALFLCKPQDIFDDLPLEDVPPPCVFLFILPENSMTKHVYGLEPLGVSRRRMKNIQRNIWRQPVPQLFLDVSIEPHDLSTR